jgi:hypothetical protein
VDFTPQAIYDISKLDNAVSERRMKKVEWFSENFDLISLQALKGKFQNMFKPVVED